MLSKIFICCFVIASLSFCHTTLANHTDDDGSTKASDSKSIEPIASTSAASDSNPANRANAESTSNEASKDKRQIASRETQIYPNHRTETTLDDPEIAQETIYGPNPNQFIIRAVSPHQHQQHEEHQEPPQLRNYPTAATTAAAIAAATTTLQRPHSSQQQLDQSQEIQHYAYLQDLSRNHPKTNAATSQAKSRAAFAKKSGSTRAQIQYSKPEEAEQRYAVTIQAPQQYQIAAQYRQQQQQHQLHQQQQAQAQAQQQELQQAQQYQIIPEEHFLRLIEQELQARAYHDEQLRQQQASNKLSPVSDRSGKGLGDFRQRLAQPTPTASTGPIEQTASLPPTPAYVQYVPRHRGGPKYLPLQQVQQRLRGDEAPAPDASIEPQPELPPQIAYYQPQISYKTLPNHPLAKSSLEKEIEKLLANNQHQAAAVHIIDNSNEPSAIVNHHYQHQPQQHSQPQSQPQVLTNRSPKAYVASSTPNSLLDGNNQPFVPSLFRFSNFQAPTPIYPTQVPQQVIDAKKLGPVVYPTQNPTRAQPAQPSQYYYQEAAPSASPKPKAYRPKQYELKLAPQPPTHKTPRDKAVKIGNPSKYAQPLIYDFNNAAGPHSASAVRAQSASSQFYPSPPDPRNAEAVHSPQHAQPTQATAQPEQPPNDFRQFVLPSPAPSQSSIYVSQGTGVTTPSRPHKPKTLEDVKQLRLPQPGGKPLTQAEFQALVDAGYPVTAVPVPVPVPYEQYVKDHPEYRRHPLDYAQIMRNAQQQYAARSAPRLAVASEPSVKIVSSPSEPQSATAAALGGGSVTYLRPTHSLHPGPGQQRRHPRNNDQETKTVADKEVAAEKQ